MPVTILPALEADKPTLRLLLSSYLSELSAYGEVNRAYPYFDAYWHASEQRWPYLIQSGSELIGFAFVRSPGESGGPQFSMAEFYIRPDARGGGRGLGAAKAVMQVYPGSWALSIMRRNAPAQAFWPKVIAAAGGVVSGRSEDEHETFYRFAIPAATER